MLSCVSGDGVNQHFEIIPDFLKEFHGFSVHALEQFLYNIYRKGQNQEMLRTFRESSQNPRSKSKVGNQI